VRAGGGPDARGGHTAGALGADAIGPPVGAAYLSFLFLSFCGGLLSAAEVPGLYN